MKFDRERNKRELKIGLGMSHVPDEELDQYKVQVGGSKFFGIDEDIETVNAKEYIDGQLDMMEEQFKLQSKSGTYHSYQEVDIGSVMNRLDNVAGTLDEVEDVSDYSFDVDYDQNDIPGGLIEIPKTEGIKRQNLRFFKVAILNKYFVVVINDIADDVRSSDQIKHVKTTSYFVEEIIPNEDYSDSGNEFQITYYQFVNLIEAEMRKQKDDVQTKITEGVKTTPEGFKNIDI